MYRKRRVDVHTVLGAICIYVFIGMFFAFVFTAIGEIGQEPFFAQMKNATTADYLYFSFVTMTTVGYGDLTAADGVGRATAVFDALLGQIYLVTVLALLVSQLGRVRRNPRTAARRAVVTRTSPISRARRASIRRCPTHRARNRSGGHGPASPSRCAAATATGCSWR